MQHVVKMQIIMAKIRKFIKVILLVLKNLNVASASDYNMEKDEAFVFYVHFSYLCTFFIFIFL